MARITVEDCLTKIPNRFQLVLAVSTVVGEVRETPSATSPHDAVRVRGARK